jgi:hypothetical protein
LIYEGDVRGSARQRFDPNRPGAGAQIQKAHTFDAGRKNIKERLAQAIRCWPCL